MRRSILRAGVVTGALLLLPLAGCKTREVWLEIPGFGPGTVEGVWLWRLSAQTGHYERACRIVFQGVESTGGEQTLDYIQECPDGRHGYPLRAALAPSASDPDAVTVGLWYVRWEDAGTYRVSAYGPDGESPLSETTLTL
jgi:hypothetical protein